MLSAMDVSEFLSLQSLNTPSNPVHVKHYCRVEEMGLASSFLREGPVCMPHRNRVSRKCRVMLPSWGEKLEG